jgi:hypothetical protein
MVKQQQKQHGRGPEPSNGDTVGGTLHPSVVTITPEIAAKWLERNHKDNRPLNWRRIEAMANDMRSGNWKLTHQAIAFDGEGTLLDGQHRLNAVVQAGVPVKMLIVRNDAGEFHDPIDRGASRSIALLIGKNARTVGALVVLRMLEQGCYTAVPMTLAEADEMYSHHKEQIERLGNSVPGFYKLTGGVQAACVWALPCNESLVCEWATKVLTGEMIRRGDPAYAFRGWRDRNPRSSGWLQAMAALSCIRYAITKQDLSNV